MAETITLETIDYVSILAKLKLTPEETEGARSDMQKMLDYVEKLNELDTDGVEPMTHLFPYDNVFREDIVTNGDAREEMLATPRRQKTAEYLVPKTIE